MKRTVMLAAAVLLSLSFTVGCATKSYVRKETTPIINKTNELDELTARTSNEIKDVDSRAQQGIAAANTKAAEAEQKALAAGQQASSAQELAGKAGNRVNSLANTVANLDNYSPVVETTVHFGFDKYSLTSKAKKALDEFGAEIANTNHYIVVVNGNTDSTGPAEYNYMLSQRRANAVINYLAGKYDVPAHKIFVIGLGKDNPAAENTSSSGRAENRRVEVRLMTNTLGAPNTAQTAQQ